MAIFITPLLLFLAGATAGVINSVAGGGTLISFPALMFSGVPAILANATSTAALQFGTVASLWSYRREFATQTKWAWRFGPPSLLGGLLGAILLLQTGEGSFRALVPYLILFATVLFTFQPTVSRWLGMESQALGQTRHGLVAALFFQFCVGVYGGYFGAGIGILMLAALGVLGHSNIHEMNSLKVLLSSLINGIAIIYFIANSSILWTEALIMALGAAAGGYSGPYLARRVGQRSVRTFVSVVGFVIGFYFLLR